MKTFFFFLLLYAVMLTSSPVTYSQISQAQLQKEIDELSKAPSSKKKYKKFPGLQGVYFSVQLMESESHLAPDHFRDIKTDEEVMIDSLPNKKLAYVSGIFRYYEAAAAYRRDLIEVGYKDAIIAAFSDGKRILIDEAIALVEQNYGQNAIHATAVPKATAPRQPSPKSTSPKTAPAKPKEKVTAKPKTNPQQPVPATAAKPKEKNKIVPSKPQAAASGIEFRIQIAASKKPITLNNHPALKNLKNIYSQKEEDGYIRYFIGSYVTLESAIHARKKILEGGAKEALVVAYQNKKRISLNEAHKLLAE